MSNTTVQHFYQTSGIKLIDEECYPPLIQNYLEEESKLLVHSLKSYDALVECGCMQVRNIWAIGGNDLRYLGVDLVPELIDEGNMIIQSLNLKDRAHALATAVEELTQEDLSLLGPMKRPLAFFPFNSFGNCAAPAVVLNHLQNLGLDILISSYGTDEVANKVRHDYYTNCDYDGLRQVETENGVGFLSEDGLSSWAYNLDFFKKHLLDTYTIKQIPMNEVAVATYLTHKGH